MIDLLSLHKLFLSMHIKKGDTVADFTMGGGGDTLWLSNAVGESGKVYAFDVQPMALEKTRARLQSEHAPENYTLILDSHSNLKNYIHEPIRAGVFNLGWLPGSDKTVTTLRETTRKAVVDALSILGEDGVLLVAVYPGHEEGEKEGEMLGELFASYSRFEFCCSLFRIVNSPASPFFYLIEKREKKRL